MSLKSPISMQIAYDHHAGGKTAFVTRAGRVCNIAPAGAFLRVLNEKTASFLFCNPV
jgi:hypothetical protein